MRYNDIFHVDDDEDDAEFFLEAVEQISGKIKVSGFYDARQALKKLESGLLPDAIFLDLNMPIMDGFQFLKEIKSINAFKNIPVIILSTSSHRDIVEATISAGASGFITKPSDYNQLVTILGSYLKQ